MGRRVLCYTGHYQRCKTHSKRSRNHRQRKEQARNQYNASPCTLLPQLRAVEECSGRERNPAESVLPLQVCKESPIQRQRLRDDAIDMGTL